MTSSSGRQPGFAVADDRSTAYFWDCW